jgi:DNA-binding GntR family transcriptional regulator
MTSGDVVDLRDEGHGPAGSLTRAAGVARTLRAAIWSGTIPAGTRLRQVQIAEQLGVSTTPVREALRMLEREGLVRHVTHRGAVVFRPTMRDLHENYEIRGALEPLATALAASRITDAQLDHLKELIIEMRGAEDAFAYAPLNRRFHLSIYQAADRPQLLTLIENLRDAGWAYLQLLAARHPETATAQAEHEQILEHLKARDPDSASAAMAAHLRHHAQLIEIELPEQDEPAPGDVAEQRWFDLRSVSGA